jgi:hypothetical protein
MMAELWLLAQCAHVRLLDKPLGVVVVFVNA